MSFNPMGMNGPAWGRRHAAQKAAEAAEAARKRVQARQHITLTVAPLGRGWSVMQAGAYFGEFPTQTQANVRAEEWATELRKEGHDVTVTATTKKPGGR